MSQNVPVWGLHCNEKLDLVAGGFAAMGWDELGDLNILPPTFEAFKLSVGDTYPEIKAGAVPQWAGQLYRFTHEATEGDVVVYRETGGGPIHIGRITGGYYHVEGELYGQRRPVQWVKTDLVPSDYPQGALYELGAFLTWFRIKSHADIWLDVLEGKSPSQSGTSSGGGGDKAAGDSLLDAAQIEQGTRDFLVKRLATHFKGHGFARLSAHVLELMGYTTIVSAPGKDYGVDIVAHRGVLGLEPPLIKVQVKSSEGSVGSQTVSELLGRLAPTNEAGLLITLGHFSPDAHKLSDSRANLRLIDGPEFLDLLLAHYEELDEEFTSRFPLRRVYARDFQAEADEAPS